MELPPVASKLDGALGLTLEGAEDGVANLRLDPGEAAVVEEDERTYLHGGTLATCIDTAAWYAAALLADPADVAACRMAWGRLGNVVVNSSVTKIVTGDRGSSLMTFNDHGHLEAVVPA